MFNFFKKNKKEKTASESQAEKKPAVSPQKKDESASASPIEKKDPVDSLKNDESAAEPMLDDVTFIQDMKHIPGVWHQYDVLLAARGYGWGMMVDWANYIMTADLDAVSTITTAEIANAPETELIDKFRKAGTNLKQFDELANEKGVLAVGGISRTLKAPLKIVWFNQTRVLRLFTPDGDETLMRKYIETFIRRTFGTENAMKLAKPIPKP